LFLFNTLVFYSADPGIREDPYYGNK
jgi:hypothetical protein